MLGQLLAADVERLVGPKGRHNPQRAAVRCGTQPGKVPLGGRRIRVDRPRVRSADGTAEVSLPTWQAFASTELLDQLALERMLAKLSTRRDQHGLEPVGSGVEHTPGGISRSAVWRRFVAATEHALAELWPRTCPTWTWWRCGRRHPGGRLHLRGRPRHHHRRHQGPLALAEGATENATVVRDLLVGLPDRGLEVTRPLLAVLDGAKAYAVR